MKIKYNGKWIEVDKLQIKCKKHEGSIEITQDHDEELLSLYYQNKKGEQYYFYETGKSYINLMKIVLEKIEEDKKGD